MGRVKNVFIKVDTVFAIAAIFAASTAQAAPSATIAWWSNPTTAGTPVRVQGYGFNNRETLTVQVYDKTSKGGYGMGQTLVSADPIGSFSIPVSPDGAERLNWTNSARWTNPEGNLCGHDFQVAVVRANGAKVYSSNWLNFTATCIK